MRALAVSSDGRIASGGQYGLVQVWDRTNGSCRTLSGHQAWVHALAFLPDGRLVYGDRSPVMRVWDLNMEFCSHLEAHRDYVRALAVLLDGRLVSGGDDEVLRIWNLRSGGRAIVQADGRALSLRDQQQLVASPQGNLHFVWSESSPEREPEQYEDCLASWITDLRLCLLATEDGRRSIALWAEYLPIVTEFPVAHVRAFLIEPEVLNQLTGLLPDADPLDVAAGIQCLFAPETITSNREVARLLAALPEFEFERDGRRGPWICKRLPVMNDLDRLPPRSEPPTVVFAIDHRPPRTGASV